MAVTEEMLAEMAALMRPLAGDMAKEAEHAYYAAVHVLMTPREADAAGGPERADIPATGDDVRDLYLAHFAKTHPAPDPIEEGVLQPGDKVMVSNRKGAEQGAGTLVRAYQEDRGTGPITFLEYLLDKPYASPFEDGEKIGGVTHFGVLVHARDWPRTMLGEIDLGRELEVRLGELETAPGFTT